MLVAGQPLWREVLPVIKDAVGGAAAALVPSVLADPAAEAPWRYNQLQARHYSRAKAEADLGLVFTDLDDSFAAAVSAPMFQRHLLHDQSHP